MKSAGHRANILSIVFQDMGVGYAAGGHYGEYWVVNFGAKKSQRNAVIT